jgi:hypothetical protein
MDRWFDMLLGFLLGLLFEHWKKALSLIPKILPGLWEWIYCSWMLKKGCITKGDVRVRFAFERNGELKLTGKARATLERLYEGNSLIPGLIRRYCGRNGNPFLDLENLEAEAAVYGVLEDFVSELFNKDDLSAAENLGPTREVEMVIALVSVDDGKYYRLVVVTLRQLEAMRDLKERVEQNRVGVTTKTRRLVEVLTEMAQRHQREMRQYGELRTLGQVPVFCRMEEAVSARAGQLTNNVVMEDWHHCAN